MSMRTKLNSSRSTRLFKAGIKKAVSINISPRPMRGGIRL